MSGARLRPGTAVRVRVPASSANLGPGFDSVGLALGLWDQCTAVVTRAPGLIVEVEGEGAGVVPLDPSHLVYRTMQRAWHDLGVDPPEGLHLRCVNEVPHGRGLGSSATAIVTGIVAAQGLHAAEHAAEAGLDLDFANTLAAELEGHPDNSSASVFGGLTLSWTPAGDAGTTTLRLAPHPDVRVVVLVPGSQLSTAKARSVLPTHIRHGDAAANSARAALLVQALTVHPEHLVAGTEEWLHQEARRPSFPDSMQVVDQLRAAGHAAVISGAGPSVLVLTTTERIAEVRGRAAVVATGWRLLTPGTPQRGAHLVALPAGG